MSLSNIPTWWLTEMAEELDDLFIYDNYDDKSEYDKELDQRIPDEATFYFGDCAGQPIFVPIEPECDDNGNPILEKLTGYDDKGNEVWIDAI